MSILKNETPILSILMRNTPSIPNDNSIKQLSKSLKSQTKLSPSKDFIPFINERDSTGKLLNKRPLNFFSTQTTNFALNPTTKLKPHQNIAFLSSTQKTNPRVSKKANEHLPVGLYNPRRQEKKHFAASKSDRFYDRGHINRSSLDFIDLSEVYSKNKANTHRTFNMEKQVPRSMVKAKVVSEGNLMIPRVNLPDYLKKLKGLYHVGEFGKSNLFKIQKDAGEYTLELKEKLSQHIVSLRNISTFYKTYGMKCSWKLSTEPF